MTDLLQITPRTRITEPKTGIIEGALFRFLSTTADKANFIGQGQVTTVGAAGPAAALPATPAGYQTVVVNGTEYVVPYYNK